MAFSLPDPHLTLYVLAWQGSAAVLLITAPCDSAHRCLVEGRAGTPCSPPTSTVI